MGGLRGAMGYELYGTHMDNHRGPWGEPDRWCPFCFPWPAVKLPATATAPSLPGGKGPDPAQTGKNTPGT